MPFQAPDTKEDREIPSCRNGVLSVGNADYIVLEENVGKKTNDRAGRNLWNTHETKIEGGGRTYVHI